MKILVLGGYGFIGLAVARELHRAGHRVVALCRSTETARRLLPPIPWNCADISKLNTAVAWQPYLSEVDAIVNASGALQNGLRDDVLALQDDAMRALIEAAENEGVGRFVQISAIGAGRNSPTEFFRSKASADERLKRSSVSWVILRPGLVIGASAYGGTALLRMLACLPWVLPMVYSDRRMQTVALTDVAAIVRRAVEGELPAGADLDLVAPEPHRLLDIVLTLRRWMGQGSEVKVLRLPDWVGIAASRVADALGYLGWRSPLRSTAFKVLNDPPMGDPTPLRQLLNRDLLSLNDTLAALPAGKEYRWSARLYGVLPIILTTLSAFWVITALVALYDVRRTASLLAHTELPAVSVTVVTSLLDLALGIAVLIRPYARVACVAMVLVTVLYLSAGSWLAPSLWLDPLGPFVKSVPAAALAAVAALFLEDR